MHQTKHHTHQTLTTARAVDHSPHTGVVGRVKMLREMVKSPAQIGAIAPSGHRLAREMLHQAGLDVEHRAAQGKHAPRPRVVVEYGPGTGVITDELIKLLKPEQHFFAVELNASMAAVFRRRHPGVRLHERSVAEICKACAAEGLGENGAIDVVVSGLPWSAFPVALQHELLAATAAALKPGGVMVTFAYHTGLLLASGRSFAKLLPQYFSRVTRSRPVWLNLPPAFVYRCVK